MFRFRLFAAAAVTAALAIGFAPSAEAAGVPSGAGCPRSSHDAYGVIAQVADQQMLVNSYVEIPLYVDDEYEVVCTSSSKGYAGLDPETNKLFYSTAPAVTTDTVRVGVVHDDTYVTMQFKVTTEAVKMTKPAVTTKLTKHHDALLTLRNKTDYTLMAEVYDRGYNEVQTIWIKPNRSVDVSVATAKAFFSWAVEQGTKRHSNLAYMSWGRVNAVTGVVKMWNSWDQQVSADAVRSAPTALRTALR